MNVEPGIADLQAARVRLIADYPGARQRVRTLNQDVTVIGSGEACDLILASSSVDAAHAAVVRLSNTAYLCDLGAPGGTVVSGRRVRWTRLAHGDSLKLGRYRFRVEVEEPGKLVPAENPVFCLRNEQCIGMVTNVDPVLAVGSDAGCDVVLPEGAVAPRHCLIVWTQSGPIVRDLRGRRGTRHNGRPIHIGRLLSGDSIGVGPYELIFEIDTTPAQVGRFGKRTDLTVLDPSGDSDPSWLVSGELDSSRLPQLDALWPETVLGTQESFMSEVWCAEAEPSVPAGKRATVTKASNQAEPATWPPAKQPSVRPNEVQDAGMKKGKPETKAAKELLRAVTVKLKEAESALLARSQALDERAEAQRHRVTAAQKALDERARKLWAGLRQECDRLKAQQAELGRVRAELAERESARDRDTPALDTAEAPAETTVEEVATAKSEQEPEEAESHTVQVPHGPRASERDPRPTLEEQASALAELVRSAREATEKSEARLRLLRLEVEQLQARVTESSERYHQRATALEARFQDLRERREALNREREGVMARLRELERREMALKLHAEKAECHRKELEREASRLASARGELADKRRQLRRSLEHERDGLQIRQAELRSKALELVQVTREKRRMIQNEMTKQCAALQQREAELRARRSAVETISRLELEKTATELGQVLSLRLANIESEVVARQEELETRMRALSAAREAEMEEPSAASCAGVDTPLKAMIAELEELASLDGTREEGSTTDRVQREMEALVGSASPLTGTLGRYTTTFERVSEAPNRSEPRS